MLLNEPNAALPDIAADWEFDKFPLPEMKKNGAFRGFKTADIRDKGEEAIRWLAEKAGGFSNLPLFAFRKTDDMRLSAKLNRYALMGWCLQVMAEAAEIETAVKFPKADLVLLSVFEEGPKLAREYLLTAGIILHPVKHLKATYLDGATFYLPDGRPVIAVTLRYDRLDNFWFVVLHELGHLLLGHLSPEFFLPTMPSDQTRTPILKERRMPSPRMLCCLMTCTKTSFFRGNTRVREGA